MNNFTLLSSMLLLACGTCLAQNTTKDEAREIALDFFSNKSATTRSAVTPEVKMAYSEKNAVSGNVAFFVFNRTDVQDGGFVIVSASEDGERIMGYSDRTTFDYSTAPEGVKSLLYLMANNTVTDEGITRATEDLPKTVAPMMTSKWDQREPYNLMCPSDGKSNAVTGCGATCVSQVAYFYKYPTSGTGSHQFTSATNKFACSFDFGKATFDYANMTDTYDKSSTTEQKNAVAELMYAAGVAVNTDYKIYPRSSTCTLNNVAVGLKNYFNYDAGMSVCRRDYYTVGQWKEMLCSEISQGRPVIYQGIGASLGHVFVLDGYNSSRMFHINWGWGGTYDGYYNVGDLQVGNYGALDTYLWVIRGIKPAEQGSIQSSEIYADNISDVNVGSKTLMGKMRSSFKLDFTGLVNQNYAYSTMDIGYILVDEKGDTLETKSITSAGGRGEMGNATGSCAPSKLANGCFTLIPAAKQSNSRDWAAMLFRDGAKKYVNIDVRADSAFAYTAAKTLAATDIQYAVSEQEGDSTYTITCNVKNTASSDYANGLRVEICEKGTKRKMILAYSDEQIAKKATQSITFTSSTAFESGEYTIFIVNAEGHTIGMDDQTLEAPISTGILAPEANANDAIYYDLSGRRVKKGTENGILIRQNADGKASKEYAK